MSLKNKQKRLFYGMPFHHWLIYRSTWWFIWIINLFIFRTKYTGLKDLPKDKPYLLLPNHSSMLDPFWVAHPMYRPSRFMGSVQLLQIPFLGKYLRILGTFPKKKFTKDKESMQNLQEFYDQGYVITLFPEGNRCWDGRTGEILPGIGRLIKRMDANVVYARMTSAHFFHPRWAKYPRWVPIEIEYDGPYTYPEHFSAEEVTAEVNQYLKVKASFPKNKKTFGLRMAIGLEQYLWACPACMKAETLKVPSSNQNSIDCASCNANWSINTRNQLIGTTNTTVNEASEKIEAYYGEPPILDQERFEKEDIAFGPIPIILWFYPRKKKREKRAQGHLLIRHHRLIITKDNEEIFSHLLEEIRAISVEVGNKLFFRFEGRLYQLDSPTDSPIKISHFMKKWKLTTTGTEY
jgi:1-acyl-sn-glycerol-3-phosphate acyltransferase